MLGGGERGQKMVCCAAREYFTVSLKREVNRTNVEHKEDGTRRVSLGQGNVYLAEI